MKRTGLKVHEVLLRGFLVGAAATGVFLVVTAFTPPEAVGADIGAGLMAFGFLIVVTLLWGVWDGARRGVPAFLLWALAGLIGALVQQAGVMFFGGVPVGQALLGAAFALIGMLPVVYVPAALGIGVGLLFRRLRGRPAPVPQPS